MKFFERLNLYILPKLSTNSQLYTGFTLAEVLITLGIIGVVAAMTIPTLIKSYQAQAYVSQLKKTYSQFNQIFQQIASDHGCTGDLACTGLFVGTITSRALGDEVVKYIKVINNCEVTSVQNCWAANVNQNFDGSSASVHQINTWSSTYNYRFVTIDGMSINIQNYGLNGVGSGYENCKYSEGTGELTQICGTMWIDLNGPKGPNNLGRDAFMFLITNGKGPLLYYFNGYQGIATRWWNYNNLNRCSSSSTGTDKIGDYCLARIIEKGWIMDY